MRILILLLAMCLAGCASTQNLIETAAITDARTAFPAFVTHDPASNITVDHAAFDTFLKTYLVKVTDRSKRSQGATLVRYGDVTDTDKSALIAYIDRLQNVDVSALSRNEQLAFWINLYNAETIRVILENYPVDSIRDIKSHPLDFKGPWNDKRLVVEGEPLTLDNIENLIVRPVFDDPRIHYALNCAAIGCPDLRNKSYRAANLDAVLDTQADAFINNPRGVSVRDGQITVSKIFLWYQEDYGSSDTDILNHIRKYAEPDLLKSLENLRTIDRYKYDWALNDAVKSHSNDGL